MAIKTFKPYTPCRRGYTVTDYSILSKDKPDKSLLDTVKKHAGRNNQGKVTVRHRGHGNKKHYRLVDFGRSKDGVNGVVKSIQYDPFRSAFIALVHFDDGTKSYVLAPDEVKVGFILQSGKGAEIRPGNTLPLSNIPEGTLIHNIELKPGSKGTMVRAAGTTAQLLAKEGNYAQLRLPSGEVRIVPLTCKATVGRVSNIDHENVKLGKAGRAYHRGRRPKVRGTAMNATDHPHGGGEGKSNSGRPPASPTGVLAKGFKTRKKSKSKRYIVKDRRVK